MPTSTRLYYVVNKTTNEKRLVRASHPSQAVRFVAGSVFDVGVPTQDALVEMLTVEGLKIEDAGAEALQ